MENSLPADSNGSFVPKKKRNLNVLTSTSYRTYKRFECTGSVDPSRNISRLELRKIDEHIGLYVIGLVMEKPSFYLGEICQEIGEMFQIEVSPSLIFPVLKDME